MTTKPLSLIRGTAIVSSLTLVSRILGFVRDLLVATAFGAGMYADAFFVAFRIPNLLRSFVAEGAMSSAFVPVFADGHRKGPLDAQRAFSSILSLVLISGAVLSIAGLLFPVTITSIFAPGFSEIEGKADLCARLTQIMFPFVICVSLVALFNGALSTCGIFGASAWAQIVMNLVLIIGGALALATDRETGVYLLAWSVLAGGLAQVVAQLPALRRAGLSLTPSRELFTPATRTFFSLLGPALLGATAYQLMIFLSTLLASLLPEGSVSWLNYADRVTQLPVGIFSVALASVLLPALSRSSASNDHAQFSAHLSNSLRFTSFVLIPLAAWIALFAPEIVYIAFERGAFGAEDTLQTVRAIQALSLGLWAASCHSMIARAFIARRDTGTPMRVGIFSLLCFTVFATVLMGPPASAEGASSVILTVQSWYASLLGGSFSLGHVGIALASSASSLISFLVILGAMLPSDKGIALHPFVRATFSSSASTALSVIAWVVLEPSLDHLSPPIRLIAGGALVTLAWLLAHAALRNREFLDTTSALARRFNR